MYLFLALNSSQYALGTSMRIPYIMIMYFRKLGPRDYIDRALSRQFKTNTDGRLGSLKNPVKWLTYDRD